MIRYCKLCLLYVLMTPIIMCADAPKIVLISIPKSGTTLMRKLIKGLTGQVEARRAYAPELYLVKPKDFERIIKFPPNIFWSVHLFYNADYAGVFKKKNYKTFFIYRDPRDQLVSFMFYMIKYQNLWTGAGGRSQDEIITNLIETASFAGNSPPARGIADLYRSYLSWFNEPHVLAIRFEDIVGEKGGGSDEGQLFMVRAVAEHLGLSVSDEKLATLARELFGGTVTFREGKIGSWKTHFTEQHKKRFKEVAGQLLIDLGYESDFDW